jgi:hypothetical protein
MGLEKAGYEIIPGSRVQRVPFEIKDDYTLAVLVGDRPPLSMLRAELNRKGIPVLILELGYLKRPKSKRVGSRWTPEPTEGDYYQVGLNGLCWLPPAGSCPGDRFENLKITRRKTRKTKGETILILGQTVGDAQHNYDLRKMIAWLTRTITTIKTESKREIVWRPHPKQEGTITSGPLAKPGGADRVSLPSQASLEKDIQDCHAAVTINSTAGNFALLAGAPVFCEPFAIYKEVANADLTGIDRPHFYDTGDYFNRLAYAQWTKDEIKEGAYLEFMEPYLNEFREKHSLADEPGDTVRAN